MRASSDQGVRPFLKWAGSKRSLASEILKRLPQKMNTYYEPFLGGGAVFFALAAERRMKSAVLSDINLDLAITYMSVRQHPDDVIRALKKHKYAKRYYNTIRAQNPERLTPINRAARFIYLNRTCFNGLYRVNRKGQFNVPFGAYTNPTICDEANLRAVSETLNSFSAVLPLDFEGATRSAKRGDVVYFDPPYAPLSETSSFTAFSKGGFGEKEQVRLRHTAAFLADRGVHVLLSNSDTPFIRRLYRGFKIETVKVSRRINSKGDGRGNVNELLISWKK